MQDLYKMGIRLLDTTELINILPNYESIKEKFAVCREAARENMKEKSGHYQYNLMYDNVFSIMGKRGTGKTSVLFTLRKELEGNKEITHDVVFPVVIPEIIPECCDILGWILAIVGDCVAELEKGRERRREDAFSPNCRYSNDSFELTERYRELLELCFSAKYNAEGESSFYDAVANSSKQAKAYYTFMKKMDEFWDAFIKEIEKKYFFEENDNPPMFFFFFDDVDLAPDRVEELLSIIMRYLAHPNIIVVTTADEQLFLEVMQNRFEERMGRKGFCPKQRVNNFMGWGEDEQNVDNKLTDMAQRYLEKIIPPATRYYLELFDKSSDKNRFIVAKGNKSLLSNIDIKIQKLLSDKESSWVKSEIGVGDITFYLNFMGNTPRQISNAYLIVSDYIEKAKKVLKTKTACQRIYDYSRQFLHTSIITNNILTAEIKDLDSFLDNILLREYDGWNNYVNYQYVLQYFKGKNKCINSIFSLLMFMEHIFLCVERNQENSKREKVHGIYALAQYYNTEVLNANLINGYLNENKFLYHYQILLENIADIDVEVSNTSEFSIKYFNSFLEQKGNFVFDRTAFLDDSGTNEWVEDTLSMATILYSGLYKINHKTMIYKQPKELLFYGSYMGHEYIIKSILSEFCGTDERLEWRDNVSMDALADYVSNMGERELQKGLEIIKTEDITMKDILLQIDIKKRELSQMEKEFKNFTIINKEILLRELEIIENFSIEDYDTLWQIKEAVNDNSTERITSDNVMELIYIMKNLYKKFEDEEFRWENDNSSKKEHIKMLLRTIDYGIFTMDDEMYAHQYCQLIVELTVLYIRYLQMVIEKKDIREVEFEKICYYEMYRAVLEYVENPEYQRKESCIRLKNIISDAKRQYMMKYIDIRDGEHV